MAHRIQNFETLAETDLRRDALAIAEAGYTAVDVGAALVRTLRIEGDTLHIGDTTYPLAGRQIYFVGVGKCALAGAWAVEQLLGERLTGGIALDVSSIEQSLTKIEAYVGTHPLPSETNEAVTKRIFEFLSGRAESDLVLMLISGGGSTLLCAHSATMTCTDESLLWSELTARGATIQDINTIRKHTSRARGGGLAAAAYPAEVASLIVSDVPGNDIRFVASGPTVPDDSTIADARAVLARIGIESAANIEYLETPKEPKYFERVTNTLFLSSADALRAMREEAAQLGYASAVADDGFVGEAREVGRNIATRLHDTPAKTVLLFAGESTVTLAGPHGAGGRNQELALSALEYLNPDELILSFDSDGRDNTDSAGAIGDETTRGHAFARNLSIEEHLENHRAYDFFKASGDALITGYTGSNVSDIIIAMKK